MINKTKIVIADDMEPILLYLENVISSEPDFQIVGRAKNGKELIKLVQKYSPEIVVTDEEMPECNGIEAIEELNKEGIKAKYILITGNYDCVITSKANNAGIVKVIKKPILDNDKFIAQIKEVVSFEAQNTQQKVKENVHYLKTNQSRNNKYLIKKIAEKIFGSK